ncbi:Hypothetical protein NTJ_13483 [Nesidiocoris tenuis]|uniref:DUF4774 domain-containing protein n=1 Tax=Nesidiocoris tenuis TaxID=355587 RepID=A0ABN7BBZ4_9HEMI|nr:Hypothetical protein NTJ_13483 [Nesidiocoris tenuis]
MFSQVVFVVGLVGLSVAYPRTYQEQRQIYYTQPLPVQLGPYQIPQQAQVLQYQLPASTSFLPNNVPGVRYGQQQVVYVVPGGSQVLFEEGSTGGQGNSPYLESFMNFLNGHLPSAVRPGQQAPEKPAEKPDKVEEKPIENAPEEQSASVEEPQKPQQQQVELLNPQQLNGQQSAQQQQLQQYPVLHQQSPLLHQQSALPFAPLAPQDQQLLQQRFYLLNQQQQQPQQLFGRPSIAGPSANFLLNYRTYPLSDKKPGSSAIAFQKLLQKNAEAAAAAANSTEVESTESDSPSAEEIGPSIAQAKPQAVSVAGVGGVAAAAPVGTAIVGPGGMALSAPTATAVAGTKPRPGDKTKSSYLSRSNLFPF